MVRGHGGWQRTDSQLEGIVSMSDLLLEMPWALSKDCEGALLIPDLLRDSISLP
jgi:hypothetical protein